MVSRTGTSGPLTTIDHNRPGWICVTLAYDRPGCETPLHRHSFDHWMLCEAGAARIAIDDTTRIVKPGDRYLVEAGRAHGVLPLVSGTRLRCEHEIRAENGARLPEAFSPDGIPVEWLQRLTETWGPVR